MTDMFRALPQSVWGFLQFAPVRRKAGLRVLSVRILAGTGLGLAPGQIGTQRLGLALAACLGLGLALGAGLRAFLALVHTGFIPWKN